MTAAIVLKLQPARRQTLGDSVANSLRSAIFAGMFKPGERIAEAQIATGLQVSRAPVRDALAVLEREGLVRRTANYGGAIVIPLARKDVEEICSLRIALESLAIRLAVRHGSTEDLEQLAENIRATEKAEGPGQAGVLDLQFHELLVRSVNHERLLSSWLGLRSQIQLVLVSNNIADPEFGQKAAKNHRKLLELLRARDEERAVAELARQTEGFHGWAVEMFGDEGQGPAPKPGKKASKGLAAI